MTSDVSQENDRNESRDAPDVNVIDTPDARSALYPDFPPNSDQLPKVALSKLRLTPDMHSWIVDGVVDGEDQAAALGRIYAALQRKAMNMRQIASVVWNSDHKISEVVRTTERGYVWMCLHIKLKLSEARQRIVERDEALFNRYIWVERARKYWDRADQDLIEVVTLKERLINAYGLSTDFNAHHYWLANFTAHKGVRVRDVTYWPGQPELTRFANAPCVNIWQAPNVFLSNDPVQPWLDLVARIIPDAAERAHFLNLMAWIVQNPGKKPGHHLLLGGKHGIGKDTMLEPIFYAIGGGLPVNGTEIPADRINVTHIKTSALEGGFDYHLTNQVICIQELKEVYGGVRKNLANQLKSLLAAPPHTAKVNTKYGHPFDIPNTSVWMATSNFSNALPLDRGERRWFAIWSNAEPLSANESAAIWKWYCEGGVQAVAGWLSRWDVSKFQAHARAPDTTWKATLVESGLTDIEAAFHRFIDGRVGPFAGDLAAPGEAAQEINSDIEGARTHNRIGDCGSMPKKVTPGNVGGALTEAGWHSLGEIERKVVKDGKTVRTRLTLFAAPGTASKYIAMKKSQGGHGRLLDEYFRFLKKRGL